MKNLIGIALISTLVGGMMMVAGCSGNNVGTTPSVPEAVEGAAGAGQMGTPQPLQIDSASNGGSSLAAAAPYAGDGKGGAVQQNINATPFLQASTPMKAGMELPAGALVSRADGTMYGPTDMSPAGEGQGTTSSGTTASQSSGAKSTGAVPAKQTNNGATPK